MRWIREFFRPSLKCERLGHSFRPETRQVAAEGGGFRNVITIYDESWEVCSVCGAAEAIPDSRKMVTGFQSASLPSSFWNKMREDGFVFWD